MSEANTRGRAASGDGAFATLRHIPELDGVRAISVLFVLLVHASYGRIVGGFLGVDVFFVLSGYLITRLLMRERSVTGTLDLASFYMRRVLRILPPLIVCVALAMAVWPVPGASLQDRLKVISAVMFFYANFYDADVLQCLVHTWSLAIEEQFYLFWPALFLMLRTRARLVALAATVVAVSIAVRTLMVAEGAASATYTFTVTRIDSIAVGALLALCEPELEGALSSWGAPLRSAIAWIGVGLLLAALLFATKSFMESTPVAFTIFAIVAAAFILSCQGLPASSLVGRGLSHPLMSYLGRRSYGLYLLHYPVFLALEPLRVNGDKLNFVAVTACKIGVSLIVTEMCWRLVERPVLQLKARYQPVGAPSASRGRAHDAVGAD